LVADALSRKSPVNMLAAHLMPYELAKEFDRLSLGFLNNTQGALGRVRRMMRRSTRSGS
jgi:hypothetical protein